MKKNVFKFLSLIFLVSFAFISCSEKNTDIKNVENRNVSFQEEDKLKDELIFYSMTEDYKLTEEEVYDNLKSFLALKTDSNEKQKDSSRAAVLAENTKEIKKVKSFSKTLPEYKNHSRSISDESQVNISVYEITDQNTGTKEVAITSDDERVGSVLCLIEDEEHSEENQNPVLEIFLSQVDGYIENIANELESITEDDYELFKEKYNITDEEIAAAKAEYENSENSRKFWGYGASTTWSICDINLNNLISKTEWNQWEPYNDAISEMEGNYYPTGCGTTAVAQIMVYHEWPLSYSGNDLETLKSKWLPAAEWDGVYDWEEMTSSPDAESLSERGKMQVAALMYEVSKGCKSEYEESGTSTDFIRIIECLRNKGFSCNNTWFYSYNKISNSLSSNCPVIIFGKEKNTDKGHFWIIDGSIKTKRNRIYYIFWIPFNTTDYASYVHCNYGWGGEDNEGKAYTYRGQGYYKSGIFETENGDLSENLFICTNIRPDN